ncbi:MAG: FixH family protein [Bacteroidota bacterium]
MFKKFNWGHGIFIFYVCFVTAVVTALVASFGVDHSLVVEDYYAQDLAYQSQYDKVKNNLESQNIEVDLDEVHQRLTININHEGSIQGAIEFYRPSDKSKDFNVKLKDQVTTISTKDLLTGKWVLKIDWKEGNKSFYKEELIYI